MSEPKPGDGTADAVIEEALRSVEQGTAAPVSAPAPAPVPEPAPPAPEAVPAPVAAVAPAQPAPVAPAAGAPAAAPSGRPPPRPVALAPVPESEAQNEIRKLRNDLLETRQALRQREAELEISQQMGREGLGKLKDQHERTLRAVADLENYKKRVVKERDEAAKFGLEKALRDFLPILDNFDRALGAVHSSADFEALRTGVQMTRKLFEDSLGKYGVKGFSALGQPFDPRLHEAIQTVESDAPAGTVVMEVVRGYTLHERLMRPAMVAVAKPRADAPVAAPDAPTDPALAQSSPESAGAESPAKADESTQSEDT